MPWAISRCFWADEVRSQLGLIAQEVEAVLPELVSTDKDAKPTKGLNYLGLVPVTIKALQEQQEFINEQQSQLASTTTTPD
jgi:hypothetical protein